jgi:hypothetical protein
VSAAKDAVYVVMKLWRWVSLVMGQILNKYIS